MNVKNAKIGDILYYAEFNPNSTKPTKIQVVKNGPKVLIHSFVDFPNLRNDKLRWGGFNAAENRLFYSELEAQKCMNNRNN